MSAPGSPDDVDSVVWYGGTVNGDGMCVYGNSGSFRAACDRDATTTRGGFEYCDEHAAWIDRAKAFDAVDEELAQ